LIVILNIDAFQGCGHQIVTERQLAKDDHDTIRALFEFVDSQLQFEKDYLGSAILVARDPSDTPQKLSGSPSSVQQNLDSERPQLKSHFASNGDSFDHSEEPPKTLGRPDHSTGVETERIGDKQQVDSFPKFLVVCYPTPEGRTLKHLQVLHKTAVPTDQALISGIRKTYFGFWPALTQLIRLRGFSVIRLARVRTTLSECYYQKLKRH
jgi:hypothetical protein